jgi:hypothetical protein
VCARECFDTRQVRTLEQSALSTLGKRGTPLPAAKADLG